MVWHQITGLFSGGYNETSFLLSLVLSAWFYKKFKKLERELKHEEMLEQLLDNKAAS